MMGRGYFSLVLLLTTNHFLESSSITAKNTTPSPYATEEPKATLSSQRKFISKKNLLQLTPEISASAMVPVSTPAKISLVKSRTSSPLYLLSPQETLEINSSYEFPPCNYDKQGNLQWEGRDKQCYAGNNTLYVTCYRYHYSMYQFFFCLPEKPMSHNVQLIDYINKFLASFSNQGTAVLNICSLTAFIANQSLLDLVPYNIAPSGTRYILYDEAVREICLPIYEYFQVCKSRNMVSTCGTEELAVNFFHKICTITNSDYSREVTETIFLESILKEELEETENFCAGRNIFNLASFTTVWSIFTIVSIISSFFILIDIFFGGHHGNAHNFMRISLSVSDFLISSFAFVPALMDDSAFSNSRYLNDTLLTSDYITINNPNHGKRIPYFNKDAAYHGLFNGTSFWRLNSFIPSTDWFPIVRTHVLCICICVTLIMLFYLGVERFIMVWRPFLNKSLFLRYRVIGAIISAWVIGLASSLLISSKYSFTVYWDRWSKLYFGFPYHEIYDNIPLKIVASIFLFLEIVTILFEIIYGEPRDRK